MVSIHEHHVMTIEAFGPMQDFVDKCKYQLYNNLCTTF